MDHGIVRSADNWSVVIERAKKVTVDLSLHFNIGKETRVSDEEGPISEDSSTAMSSDEDSELKLRSTRSSASSLATSPLFKSRTKGQKGSAASQYERTVSMPSAPDVEAKIPEATNPNDDMSLDHQARLGKFHIFQWFVDIPNEQQSSRNEPGSGLGREVPSTPWSEEVNARAFNVNSDRLKTLFKDMHRMMRTRNGRLRRLHRKGPSHSLKEIEDRLAVLLQKGKPDSGEAESQSNADDDHQPDSRTGSPTFDVRNRSQGPRTGRQTRPSTEETGGLSEEGHAGSSGSDLRRHKRRLVKNAKGCFVFFLPLEYSSDMVSKHWGAVYSMIDVSGELTINVLCWEDTNRREEE